MLTSEQLASIGMNPQAYDTLRPEEKEAVDEVLKQLASGSTDLLDQLYSKDYDEIPVDFNTFITDDKYLGKSTRNGQFLYPFWRKEDQKIFQAYQTENISEVALSGSIGVGKSTNGVLLMLYHLYCTMCMKDPQSFFSLAPGSQIAYAFINNTLSSSYGVAYQAFQAFIQESPWFLKHGKLVGRDHVEYLPEKGFTFVVGSRPQHSLGKHVICLSGDTVIETTKGEFKIADLEGQVITVPCLSDQGEVTTSNNCTVQKTGEVTELIEIELEDGSVIKCTPEHQLMLKDGTYKMAKDLSEEDELLDIN